MQISELFDKMVSSIVDPVREPPIMNTDDWRGVGRPATPKRLASKRAVISGRNSMAPQPVPNARIHKELARHQLAKSSTALTG